MSKRVMGKASFCNIQDLPGNIQCYVARDSVGEEPYAAFKKMDIGDILDIHNSSSGEHIEYLIKGIAIFDNFEDLTDSLTPQALGYDSKEEVIVRTNRMFSEELRQNLNVVAFFLEPYIERGRFIERGQFERDEYTR